MANKKVSVEDWVDISNLLGKYQWLVDEGDQEGWAGLFTEDGFFEGLGDGFYGREALKQIPALTKQFGGMLRHLPGAIWIEQGADENEAFAHVYSLVTTWLADPGPELSTMALCKVSLLRIDAEWKIKSNTVKLLRDMF